MGCPCSRGSLSNCGYKTIQNEKKGGWPIEKEEKQKIEKRRQKVERKEEAFLFFDWLALKLASGGTKKKAKEVFFSWGYKERKKKACGF